MERWKQVQGKITGQIAEWFLLPLGEGKDEGAFELETEDIGLDEDAGVGGQTALSGSRIKPPALPEVHDLEKVVRSLSFIYSRVPARTVLLQDATALRDGPREYREPFVRGVAGRPAPRECDLCSSRAPGKNP
jgi:hypothetical protein